MSAIGTNSDVIVCGETTANVCVAYPKLTLRRACMHERSEVVTGRYADTSR